MSLPCPKLRYAPPLRLAETPPVLPREAEVQALWFERLLQPRLSDDRGGAVEVIQPGFWNHGSGPDFRRAALQFYAPDGTSRLATGAVEIHLRARDWSGHRHEADPAYDETILHAVWEDLGEKKLHPATSKFSHVPQVFLRPHLIAPWAELKPICASLVRGTPPQATLGRCAPLLNELAPEALLELLRSAGRYRLDQKERRWLLRRRLSSPTQALFEALAEALGYHSNQIPLRLVAQRLPWSRLKPLPPLERRALLFGLAGFLPQENLRRYTPEVQAWLRPLWEVWWKAREPLEFALLPPDQWKLTQVRPLNRPERRLAALAAIVDELPYLETLVRRGEEDRFSAKLLALRDPFWEQRATLAGSPLAHPQRLLGAERLHDILINVFWPLAALDEPEKAREAWSTMTMPPNSNAKIAAQRLLVAPLRAKHRREALVQQGLLQIYRDYCSTDCSDCGACTFPAFVARQAEGEQA